MAPVLVFFGVAALIGLALVGIVALRLRAVQRDEPDGAFCELRRARRITSVALLASLVGLTLAGLLAIWQ